MRATVPRVRTVPGVPSGWVPKVPKVVRAIANNIAFVIRASYRVARTLGTHP